MAGIWEKLSEQFGPEKIVTALQELIPKLLIAGVVLLIFYGSWRLVAMGLRKILSRAGVDRTAQSFIQMFLKYTLMAVAFVMALGELGIDTGSVLTSLGIAGLTIGFAARDALSNIISGIFIFWDRPFVIGDLIEVGGQYGRVERITMRSTRVVTPDGRMLAVPNSQIVNTTVGSYTNFPHLRLDVEVTVGVGEDLGRVRQVLLALLQGDERFMNEPAPQVVIKQLNDYNVCVELQAWLQDETTHVAVRFELRERVFESLRQAGVDMPFETLQIQPVEIRTTGTKLLKQQS